MRKTQLNRERVVETGGSPAEAAQVSAPDPDRATPMAVLMTEGCIVEIAAHAFIGKP